MINLFSENHSSNIEKVNSFVTTNPNESWVSSTYANSYRNKNPIHISERLFFLYGGVNNLHPTVKGMQLELQSSMIPRLKALGLSDEQIKFVKESIDDIFADGDLYELSKRNMKRQLENHITELDNEIDEIMDTPVMRQNNEGPGISRFLPPDKPERGTTPPEGILVTKSGTAESFVSYKKGYKEKPDRFTQHLYINPKKEKIYLPKYRGSDINDPGEFLHYEEVDLFIEENDAVKLNWDKLFLTPDDVNKYLTKHTDLTPEQIKAIDGDYSKIIGDGTESADDIKQNLVKFYGKRPEPHDGRQIRLFSLFHMKRISENRLIELLDGEFDDLIAKIAFEIKPDDTVRQMVLFGTVIEEYKRIGRGTELDIDPSSATEDISEMYPDVKDLNDLLRLEMAKSINHLVKSKGGTGPSIAMNYAMLSIMYKKLDMSKTWGPGVDVNVPWDSHSVYNDVTFLDITNPRIEEQKASLIRAYKPESPAKRHGDTYHVYVREYDLAEGSKWSEMGSVFHRSLSSSGEMDYGNYGELIGKDDPFGIFLDTFYPNQRLGVSGKPDRALQYDHFLRDLKKELDEWIKFARGTFKGDLDKHAFHIFFEPLPDSKTKARLGRYFQGIEGDTSLEQQLNQVKRLIDVLLRLNEIGISELVDGVNPIKLIKYTLLRLLF